MYRYDFGFAFSSFTLLPLTNIITGKEEAACTGGYKLPTGVNIAGSCPAVTPLTKTPLPGGSPPSFDVTSILADEGSQWRRFARARGAPPTQLLDVGDLAGTRSGCVVTCQRSSRRPLLRSTKKESSYAVAMCSLIGANDHQQAQDD